MSELELQQLFATSAASLIQHANTLGYHVTLGEAYRPSEMAKLYAQSGKGIANSLHCQKLAIDINLFTTDDTYITDGVGHTQLGAWWKALGPQYYWGGDFSTKDFNHYSISPDGGHTK